MASRSETKRARVEAFLAAHNSPVVDDALWTEMRQMLAPVSESYLRKLLREMKTLLTPLVDGVCQDSFEDLERTLLALQGEYSAGNKQRTRTIVIVAKDHARWALKRAKEETKRAMKEEMILWMKTWLENPELFPAWVALRKRAAGLIEPY